MVEGIFYTVDGTYIDVISSAGEFISLGAVS